MIGGDVGDPGEWIPERFWREQPSSFGSGESATSLGRLSVHSYRERGHIRKTAPLGMMGSTKWYQLRARMRLVKLKVLNRLTSDIELDAKIINRLR